MKRQKRGGMKRDSNTKKRKCLGSSARTHKDGPPKHKRIRSEEEGGKKRHDWRGKGQRSYRGGSRRIHFTTLGEVWPASQLKRENLIARRCVGKIRERVWCGRTRGANW